METINKYFKISERKSTFTKEIIGGLIVFITMLYIILVQGGMLGPFMSGDVNTNIATIGIITALSAGLASIAMGIGGKHPISLASGMGINAFVAYTLIAGGMPFATAMVAVILSGVLFVIVALSPVKGWFLEAIPDQLKKVIAISVGLFIMFVALINTNIIITPGGTPVGIGDFSNPSVLLAIITILVTLVLWRLEFKTASIIGIGVSIVIGVIFFFIQKGTGWGADAIDPITGANSLPGSGYESLNLNEFYGTSFTNVGTTVSSIFTEGFKDVEHGWSNPEFYVAIFILFLNDMFDTTGTTFGVNEQTTDISSDELNKASKRILIVDAFSTVGGGMLGATNVTVFAESVSGAQFGARTGLSAVVTGTLFLLTIPVIPLITPLVTSSVTVGALVLVGVMMASLLSEIEWKDKTILISAVMTIMFTLLTYSIGTGIVIGVLVYTLLTVITGKAKENHWFLWVLTPILIMFLVLPIIMTHL